MDASLIPSLLAAAEAIRTVDAHQHLSAPTPLQTDLCQVMVQDNYLLTSLGASGLTPETARQIADPAVPLAARWQQLKPFWQQVQHTAYAQAHRATYRDLYGARDLADAEIEKVSARLAEDYAAPGLFERLFAQRCGIDAILTQGEPFQLNGAAVHWVARPVDLMDFRPDGGFEKAASAVGASVQTPADLVPAIDGILHSFRRRGAVGFKFAALPWREPTTGEVREAFAQRHHAAADPAVAAPLVCLCLARTAALAEEYDIPVAIHTGAPWANWLDFRTWEPTALIPLLNRFRGTRFDLYHAGIPYVTPFSVLGLSYPNVWLNLCWAHVISPELAKRAMREWLDLIPTNKVVAFGGDYHNGTVVLTYGHLALARRNVAEVLAERIGAGRLTREQACAAMRAWFSDNPRRLYPIG